MKARSQAAAEEFRRFGHQVVDWIADYRASVGDRPVMARTEPGAVKAQLPDAHSDFVFAVAGEEFGLIACLLIVAVYLFIVLRGLSQGFAARNGQTLVIGAVATHAVNPWLFSKLPFDPVRDFQPIARAGTTPFVMTVLILSWS